MALVAVLCHSGAYTVVFATFHFNQDFIAKNLCVNRAKPAMQCNGKCYLKKQMAEQEQQQQGNNLVSEQQSAAWLFQPIAPLESIAIGLPTAAPVAHYSAFVAQHSEAPRPQPPCLA